MSILLTVLLMTAGLTQGLDISPMKLKSAVSQEATFSCNGNCNGLTWTGPALEHGMDRVNIRNVDNSVLVISNLSVEDAGNYTCSCSNQHATARLNIEVPPSSAPEARLSFQQGQTAIIPCLAFPGNPPYPIIWRFNGRSLLENHEKLLNNTVRILNVQMQDAGTYTCRFDVSLGDTGESDTIVMVEPRPPEIKIIEFVAMPRKLVLTYGDPLQLNCILTNSSVPANLSWTVTVGSATQFISTSNLNLESDDVQSGTYSCEAHNAHENLHASYEVQVTVNVWPVFRSESVRFVTANEGEPLSYEEQTVTTAPVIDNTIITWKKKDTEQPVDFGSRLFVQWNGNTLRWYIDAATMEDEGEFLVNISNEFGSSVITVSLDVSEVPKEKVCIQLMDIPSCQFLKDHQDELVVTVAREYSLCLKECNRSLINNLLDSLEVTCKDEDKKSADISVNIPKKHIEAFEVTSISFAIAGHEFTGEIIDSTPSPPTPDESTIPITTIVPITVIASISIVVGTALIITFVIFKCKKGGHRVVVNPEAPSIVRPEVIASSYKEYQQNEVAPVVVPIQPANVPVTPVLAQDKLPTPSATPPSQSLYIPPSPVPGTRKSPYPQVTTVERERPKQLYIRSHSYSHSTRTPPDQKSKP